MTSYRIQRNFTFRTPEILIPLFKSLVRPIIEYANPVWNNSIKIYINAIEQVQRKFTKYINGFYDMSYEDRLKKLNLTSSEYWRHRGDMIQLYKIAHNHYDKLSLQDLITFKKDDRLRGHNFTIIKKKVIKHHMPTISLIEQLTL